MNFIGLADPFIVMFGSEQNKLMHRHYGIQLVIPIGSLTI
ncbi:Uncharacterised protein [Chlamydia abortus]|nr:Uncharacterised protein [Chlamydia abortus]